MTHPSARRAEAALLLVTLAWGITFPVIAIALRHASPFQFLAVRFPVALLCLIPLMPRRFPPREAWGAGGLLALLLAVSFYAQTWGLQFTTPTRSAFITGLSVIMVPLLYPLWTRRLPARRTAMGAAIALVGLYFLTDPGVSGLNKGDAITLLCALGYAIYILVLEQASRRHAYKDLLLLQFLPLAVIFLPAGLADPAPMTWSSGLVWAVVVTGPISVLTLYLQNRFQKDTTAPRTAVIFTAEPVFAALFAFLLLGEVLSGVQLFGGGLILLGILATLRS